jgi:polyphosphate kinase 2
MSKSDLPFDGAISEFYKSGAPKSIRDVVARANKRDILSASFPYDKSMKKDKYEDELATLQGELMRMQHWIETSGQRVVIIFEGRDTAGKGGAISRMTQAMNPRVARVEALPKPTEREASQWYFQRYVARLPAAGEMVLFDRSWYNRGVVEHVFGFCSSKERANFFAQVTQFEAMLVQDGVRLIKFWLNIGQAEQMRRMLARESDPMKQWKLSSIDVKGLKKWDAYSEAISETFARSHTQVAPWTVIRAEDKFRSRLNVLRSVLGKMEYDNKGKIAPVDPLICGGPEIWEPN